MQRQMADATPDLCRECGDEATVTLMGARFCLAHAQAIEEDFNRPDIDATLEMVGGSRTWA